MSIKFFKKLLTVFLLFSFSYTFSYDYSVNDNPYFISDIAKSKVDIFISKKINTVETANKYIKALNKINPLRFNDNTKNIYYYLKYRLLTYVWENNTNNVVQTPTNNTENSVTQKPINNPVIPPVISISNAARIDTTNNLSSTQKSIINKLKSSTKEYAEVDGNMEFVEYGSYYRVRFKHYYVIKWDIPVSLYLETPDVWNQILLRQWDDFILSTWWYNIEKKYSIKEVLNKVQASSTSSWWYIFSINNGNYEMFSFSDYKYYTLPREWVYLSSLNSSVKFEDSLLLQKNNQFILVTSWFIKKTLFPTNYLTNNENPVLILNSIWKDNYFYWKSDIKWTFDSIKNKTDEITNWLTTEDQKISAIFSRITKNIAYDDYTTSYLKNWFSEDEYLKNVNKAVFSWLETFSNKSWVCDGYSKLMQYMLSFAWIRNVTIESWKADVWKQKLVPHAWIRIWEKLYDPTWDINSAWISSRFKRYGLSPTEMYKTHFKDK